MNAQGGELPKSSDALAAPEAMPGFLGLRPVASADEAWNGIVLHRFRNTSGIIEVPAMRDEVLVAHTGAPFLAEVGIGTRHYERRWIGPGQLGVNPAGIPVRRDVKGRPDVVLVYLPPDRLRAVAAEMFEADGAKVELLPALASTDDITSRLIGLMLLEAERPEPGLSLMVESLARSVMIHTLRRHSNLVAPAQHQPQGLSPGRVRRVVDYMHANLERGLQLAELAQIAGLSASRFIRAFRLATGQPPHRFLVQLRVDRACQLLESTNLPVSEIGVRCGFDQPSHFASVFRQIVGVSPSEWRRERNA